MSEQNVINIIRYCRADDQLCNVKLIPATSLPDVFELTYYASAVVPIFAAESVLGKKTQVL